MFELQPEAAVTDGRPEVEVGATRLVWEHVHPGAFRHHRCKIQIGIQLCIYSSIHLYVHLSIVSSRVLTIHIHHIYRSARTCGRACV